MNKLSQPLICCIHTGTMSFKWMGPKMFNPNGINLQISFPQRVIACLNLMYLVYLLALAWQRIHTDWFLPVSAICSSLSSASPAHTPKEEYAITQTASAPKDETLHDQPEDQGERRYDKSELTEGKSLTGRWAALYLSLSMKVVTLKSSSSSSAMSLVHFQRTCLFADCVPLLGSRGRRRRSPGRNIRSSWRRRCKRPGGWCFTCR